MPIKDTEGYQIIHNWMLEKGIEPFPFQIQTWNKYQNGYSGLVIAPTGFGKTFSVFLAVIINYLNHPEKYKAGLKLIWISPLRSLAKDLQRAMQEAIDEIGLDWVIGLRNGDTPQKVKQQQNRRMPDVLIVTPETLHLLFATKNNSKFFKNLKCIAVDEWHELMSSKRGVLTELAIAQLKSFQKNLKIWGITATIGNLKTAEKVLIPYDIKKVTISAKLKRITIITSILPDSVDVLPWAGHLGGKMIDKIVPIIHQHQTTLIFTNTRSQSELWYQLLLAAAPELAGLIAIHHGSIDKELRLWIEESLSTGKLKAVIATSSLDLGVDFKPVDAVIQIGSVKGVARFMQRAGRSGHSPSEISKIYFVPTHILELIEIAAVKEAVKNNAIEKRIPLVLTFDVLIQFMVTLAVGEGFKERELKNICLQTHAFNSMTDDEWNWAIQFITQGGEALHNYEEYHKVVVEEGLYKVTNRRTAMMHRMNIGVIVSDVMLKVKFFSGGYIGMVEEYFVSKMNPGEKFILSGRVLELVKVKDALVIVKLSKGKAITPSYLGGRLPLSSDLSHYMRVKLSDALDASTKERELRFLHPLLSQQNKKSYIPKVGEFLIEEINSKEGFHLFIYPFEGRLIHEIFASLVAYRISKIKPISFTIAMNDYGFELLSDQKIPVDEKNIHQILSNENLMRDITASVNATEMASRKFRDIAVISGLVIQNVYGMSKNYKSLQSSSNLIFKVFDNYEPNSLLLKQAYSEVFNQQFDEYRLHQAFERISKSKILFKQTNSFTPLSFPIKVDSLRASMSNENLEKRIQKMLKRNGQV